MAREDKQIEIIHRLSEILKGERESKSISKNELSQRSGLSRAAIRTIENGEKQPSIYSLLKITNGLEVSLLKLLRLASKDAQ